MQTRAWAMRLFRVLFIAATAWIAFHLLAPTGYAWTVPAGAAALALVWIGHRYLRIRRARQADAAADRWAEALFDPPRRAAAIEEIRASIARTDPASEKGAREHAQLSLVLAEMLEAGGDAALARDELGRVSTDLLDERMRAMVAHARAVAAISAGDTDGAELVLDELGGACGDRAIDLRVKLLHGVIAAERGDGERALRVAEQAQKDAGTDPDLKMEARVLKAAALDAAGDRADALRVLRALDAEMLEVLRTLGLPRVKRLAAAALEGGTPDREPPESGTLAG